MSVIKFIYYTDVVLWIPAILAYWKGYISTKGYWAFATWLAGMDTILAVMMDKTSSATIHGLFCLLFYYLYKHSKDNNDPRNKRKHLLKKAGKRLPKPTLVQVRPIGAT